MPNNVDPGNVDIAAFKQLILQYSVKLMFD